MLMDASVRRQRGSLDLVVTTGRSHLEVFRVDLLHRATPPTSKSICKRRTVSGNWRETKNGLEFSALMTASLDSTHVPALAGTRGVQA